jgi:ankyrin repeat protein
MLYDSRVFNELSNEIANGSDVLGRRRLHMICAAGRLEQQDTDMLNGPRVWLGSTIVALSALYWTAIYRNTGVLRLVQASHYGLISGSFTNRPLKGRTYLHWVAAYGHLELIEYLFEIFLTSKVDPKQFLISQDDKGDTALHLAAQHGHLLLVEIVLQHTDWEQMRKACKNHRPF